MLLSTIIGLVKWSLMCLCLVSNTTLGWKIWKRKELRTIFNLGMCCYFLWASIFAPITIYNYGNMVQQMVQDPTIVSENICHRLLINRLMLNQAQKIILNNIIFRYTIFSDTPSSCCQ